MGSQKSVDRITIENLGCIDSIDIELTPFHALIGPNDSGKSTILRIIQNIVILMSGRIPMDPKKRLYSTLSGNWETKPMHGGPNSVCSGRS